MNSSHCTAHVFVEGVSECVEDAISATVTNICGDRGNPYYAAELDKGSSDAACTIIIVECPKLHQKYVVI